MTPKTQDIKEIEVVAEGNLVVDQETLDAAGLGRHLRLIIQKGEIRILPEASVPPEELFDELAGCLGQESATEYNFHLELAMR
jgi:hypothetical protein